MTEDDVKARFEKENIKIFFMTVLSTYMNRTIKDSKISFNLIFGHNSPASILKRSALGMLDNVLLALNDDQNETGY
ncbi:hypothetical protein [Psychromonas sp. MME2]|uniref:hypothetical protein n=1 Tax=unclassified Psychromonas TaxID=2614957 RepID=UPI00339C7E61